MLLFSLLLACSSGLLSHDTVFLEADFARLELLQEEQLNWSVDGLLDLDLSGAALFGDPGTWLMALRCGGCTNPAPPFLTVVETE